jgi:RNA-directed DNA polymerase
MVDLSFMTGGEIHTLTSDINWKVISNRFEIFAQNKSIECMSIPLVSLSQNSNKAEQIKYWWEEVEQKSIELALEFDYLTKTDITDCYSSIYTHSISWAIHDKDFAKNKKAMKPF